MLWLLWSYFAVSKIAPSVLNSSFKVLESTLYGAACRLRDEVI